MMQPSQDRNGNHLGSCLHSDTRGSRGVGDLLLDALMWSCLVEVGHIGLEHAEELSLVKDQQVIETFLPHTPHEPLTDRIGSWSLIRCFEHFNATCRCHPEETRPKFAVVITKKIRGCLPIGSSFSKLLCHPGIGGRSRDADMDHSSRLQFDEEERKEWSKEEIGDLDEIAGPDLSCVVAQKGRPRLASWLLGANCPHVLLDGALAHPKAQFQQFSANPFSSPKLIVLRHLPDQGDRFLSDLGLVRRSL